MGYTSDCGWNPAPVPGEFSTPPFPLIWYASETNILGLEISAVKDLVHQNNSMRAGSNNYLEAEDNFCALSSALSGRIIRRVHVFSGYTRCRYSNLTTDWFGYNFPVKLTSLSTYGTETPEPWLEPWDVSAGRGAGLTRSETSERCQTSSGAGAAAARLPAGQRGVSPRSRAPEQTGIDPSFSEAGVQKVPVQWLLLQAKAHLAAEETALGWALAAARNSLPKQRIQPSCPESQGRGRASSCPSPAPSRSTSAPLRETPKNQRSAARPLLPPGPGHLPAASSAQPSVLPGNSMGKIPQVKRNKSKETQPPMDAFSSRGLRQAKLAKCKLFSQSVQVSQGFSHLLLKKPPLQSCLVISQVMQDCISLILEESKLGTEDN
ncbi:uncharacterized protein LOC115948905 [Geospiza fortis]|uniref:Uncharacterized protein LOC115948905 n=1 Tax=Geospiza fortis TaxID=48883 RepID=A0A8N5F3M7_GEOFO|nr:uncharacterized protein LOC115948905 [Geospiza fortis]